MKMQNSRQGQPLGPLPAGVVGTIAQQSPQSYARLSQVSNRLRSTVRPVLPRVCTAPLSGQEIVRYIQETDLDDSDINTSLHSITDGRTVDISFSFSGIRISEIIPYDRAPLVLNNYLQQGFIPSLNFANSLYKRRLSCMNMNPNYAKPLLASLFKKEIDSLKIEEDEIEGYVDTYADLLGTFGELLNPSYDIDRHVPRDYNPADPESVEFQLNALKTEAQRLIDLAETGTAETGTAGTAVTQ